MSFVHCKTSSVHCRDKKLFRVERVGGKLGIHVWCAACKSEIWYSIDELSEFDKDKPAMNFSKSSELTRSF